MYNQLVEFLCETMEDVNSYIMGKSLSKASNDIQNHVYKSPKSRIYTLTLVYAMFEFELCGQCLVWRNCNPLNVHENLT